MFPFLVSPRPRVRVLLPVSPIRACERRGVVEVEVQGCNSQVRSGRPNDILAAANKPSRACGPSRQSGRQTSSARTLL